MKQYRNNANAIAKSRVLLQNPYAYLNDVGLFDMQTAGALVPPPQTKTRPRAAILIKDDKKIALAARNLQREIWLNRHQLWPKGVPQDPIELLDPAIAIKYIGFTLELSESLGVVDDGSSKFETAGVVDRAKKRVHLSRRLPLQTRRFTLAHELGHCVLHTEIVMHRDRPVSGADRVSRRDQKELDADKFATYFLMPSKLLAQKFIDTFEINGQFELNHETAFALDASRYMSLLAYRGSIEEVARLLAGAERYSGRYFKSLSTQFGVSVEAMTYRLIELGLIKRS